ncbi:MAG TPA: hypothetical protein VKG25_01520 [Bryobacteraceae bacterium]|nr:hypothetical protein [Bryobacteraceae bacterium]
MYTASIIVLLGTALLGANIPLQIVSVTSQQAEVQYTSTIAGACTLAVTDNSGYGVTVWDVNPLLTNASMDLARPDTIVDGPSRKVLLGHRVYEQGSDGKIYSRSLQADAPHTLTVTCGSDSGTIQFATRTIAQGTSYPELPQYCSGSKTWGHCLPTIDWTVGGKDTGYVDALTGALVKRVTGPGEEQNYPGVRTLVPFAGAKDQSGSSAWSNANNALSYKGGSYASTSTNGRSLFLAFGHYGQWGAAGGFYGNGGNLGGAYIDDLQLQLFVSATSGDQVSACLSLDGQTCYSGTVTRSPASGAAAIQFGDAGNGAGPWPATPWPGPFNGWSTQPLPSHLVAASPLPATVNGAAVTLGAVNYQNGITFDDEWAAGSPIYIPTSNCTNNICTIASVTDTSHLTINEPQSNLGTQTIQPLNAGILVWKSSGSGSISLNSAFGFAYSTIQNMLGAGGNGEQCSRASTTTNVDSSGNALSSPHNGFLCQFGGGSVHFWDTTAGSDRWLSDNLYNNIYGSSGNLPLGTNPFDLTSPTTWYTFPTQPWGPAGGRFFIKSVYTGNFQRTGITFPETNPMANVTVTYPFGPADLATPFAAMIASAPLGSTYEAGVTAGLWSAFPTFVGLFTGSSSTYALFSSKVAQDTVAWVFPYDVVNQVFTGAINTYSGNPGCTGATSFCGRWGSWHTAQPTGGLNYSWVSVGRLAALAGSGATGPYVIPISQVWRSTDGVNPSGSNSGWDTNTCEQDAKNSKGCTSGNGGTVQYAYNCPADTSPYWHTTQAIANDLYTASGISGSSPYYGQNNCIMIMASGQPCTLAAGVQSYYGASASAAEIAFNACPWDTGTPKTTATLQDLQVGDTIMDGNDQSASPSVPCRNCEQLTVVKVIGSYPNKQIWLYRAYNPQDGSYNPFDSSGGSAPGKFAHLNGWGPRMTPGNDNTLWFTDFSKPVQWLVQSPLPGTHGYVGGQAISPYIFGNYQAGGGLGHVAQPVLNIADVANSSTVVQGGYNQAFNGTSVIPGFLETYASATAVNAPNDLKRWVSDYRTPQTGGAGPGNLYPVTATLVGGFSHVYKIGSPTSIFDFKNSPWYGFSGRWLLKDISGPTSSITDSSTSSFCYAYQAGQCVSGSSVNDLYLNAPYIEPSTTCWSQAWDFSAPCVSTSYGVFGQAMLWDALDLDPEGRNFIRLTGLYNPPFLSAGFEALKLTPDGRWGFYKSWNAGGYRPELFAVRIPSIATDTVNRTTFVQIPVTLPAGDSVAIRFGYDSSFRCQGVSDSQGSWISGYNDSCLTVAAPTQSMPFMFSTEGPVSPSPCSSEGSRRTLTRNSCTVNIPAISGRYLYYRVERYSAAGALTDTGPTQRQAVP